MHKTRYSGGVLMVRDDLGYSSDVKALITSLRFRGLQSNPGGRPGRVTSRRNRLYRFYFPPARKQLS